jgi:hypothetical protein
LSFGRISESDGDIAVRDIDKTVMDKTEILALA